MSLCVTEELQLKSGKTETFRLKNLLAFEDIIIQCHDNPDADALACGYALLWYLNRNGKKARFIYSGPNVVTKSNLVLMIDRLEIPVTHCPDPGKVKKPGILVTVDCQYGESNVTKIEADTVAVIDHHRVYKELPAMSDVRSNFGSCSTVFYELFKAEGININEDPRLATALYYGLYTDTGFFAEISHPSDKDLRDIAEGDISLITLFKNCNLSRDELKIAGEALNKASYDDEHHYGLIEARPCDPNILGMIGDMFLEVDVLKCCLVYSILPFGVKFSVRSCVKEVKASELAAYLAEGLGGGGGHLVKAGGLLNKDRIEDAGYSYTEGEIKKLIKKRLKSYFEESEIIYYQDFEANLEEYSKYKKIDVSVGYVRARDLMPAGTRITIRTLEGDVDVTVTNDLYIAIGIDGEVYPCGEAKFLKKYKLSKAKYQYPGEYPPAVIDQETGERMEILRFAKSCIALGTGRIYAKELDHRVKVFTAWDSAKYYLGTPGDYLAVTEGDLHDVYVIAKNIFERTYMPAEED